jgi:tetratricopeptide (TPR) repeat protein
VIERARLLYGAGRIRETIDVLRGALAADPSDATARAFLSMCYKVWGHYGDAEREVKQALADDPNLSYGHYVLASIALARRQYFACIQAARESLRLDQSYTNAFEVLAWAYAEQSDWENAVDVLRSALAIEPEKRSALVSYASILRRINRLEEARVAIETSLRVAPEYADAHAIHGWILLDEGRSDEALAAFREAMRLNPYLSDSRRGLVEALKATNPAYRAVRNYAPFVFGIALAPAVIALFGSGIHVLLAAFHALVLLSYAALAAILIDAVATVAMLRRRFGKDSVTTDQRRYALIAGCCVGLNAIVLLGWLGLPSNGFLYLGIIVGCFGVLSGAALSLRPGMARFWLALYTLFFCGVALIVPLDLSDASLFHFSNPENALAATTMLILGTWLSLGGIAWLRRRRVRIAGIKGGE